MKQAGDTHIGGDASKSTEKPRKFLDRRFFYLTMVSVMSSSFQVSQCRAEVFLMLLVVVAAPFTKYILVFSELTYTVMDVNKKVKKLLQRIEVLHQEARVVAEKAVTVVKVEEKVKKAVAAANRAANAARVAAVKAVQNQMHQNSHGNLSVRLPFFTFQNFKIFKSCC